MPRRETIKRRDLLRSGLTAFGVGLAGCLGSADSPGTPTPIQHSVFRDVTIDGKFLVVQLAEDHDVSQLNLIAPDGTAYREVDIPVGSTKAEIQIIELSLSNYQHYVPGVYELVAVADEVIGVVKVELNPALEITDVRQYRDGDQSTDFAKVEVEVKNEGTSPTWVYDVTFENAPNQSSNTELSDDPSNPRIDVPLWELDQLLIHPGETRSYASIRLPFIFKDEGSAQCDFGAEMSVIVGIATGERMRKTVWVESGGEAKIAGTRGEYTCSAVEVELLFSD